MKYLVSVCCIVCLLLIYSVSIASLINTPDSVFKAKVVKSFVSNDHQYVLVNVDDKLQWLKIGSRTKLESKWYYFRAPYLVVKNEGSVNGISNNESIWETSVYDGSLNNDTSKHSFNSIYIGMPMNSALAIARKMNNEISYSDESGLKVITINSYKIKNLKTDIEITGDINDKVLKISYVIYADDTFSDNDLIYGFKSMYNILKTKYGKPSACNTEYYDRISNEYEYCRWKLGKNIELVNASVNLVRNKSHLEIRANIASEVRAARTYNHISDKIKKLEKNMAD